MTQGCVITKLALSSAMEMGPESYPKFLGLPRSSLNSSTQWNPTD